MKKIGKKVIIQAPYIDQSVRYPTGCESVSAVMLLQYLGIDITVDGFIETYLEKTGFRRERRSPFRSGPAKIFLREPV